MSNFDILDRLMQHELEGRAVAASEECYTLRRHIASLQAKNAGMEEQNAELREALKWFHSRRFALQSKFDLHGPKDMADAMRDHFAQIDAMLGGAA